MRSRCPGILLFLAIGTTAWAQPLPGEPVGKPPQEDATPEASAESKSELERPTEWGEPTEVQIGIYIIDVDEVNFADQNFAASVYYEARWNSPFLVHEGPGPLHRRITDIWTPRLVIVNQQMAWAAFPGAVEVYPDGEVVFRQKVWGRFSQPLDLRSFPLDQQTLSVHIVAAGLLADEVKMVQREREGGRKSGIARQFSLPDWDVLSFAADPVPYVPFEGQPGVPGFEMRIEVARRLPYWVTKVIVPLCLIVIMSWAPLWIDPQQIGVNIGIATTSFLTLVAYLFAISVLLPPVSYITRMDRFILLSTLMVFAGLIQVVLSAGVIKRRKIERAERIDRWSRVLYPVLLAVVLVVSFLL